MVVALDNSCLELFTCAPERPDDGLRGRGGVRVSYTVADDTSSQGSHHSRVPRQRPQARHAKDVFGGNDESCDRDDAAGGTNAPDSCSASTGSSGYFSSGSSAFTADDSDDAVDDGNWRWRRIGRLSLASPIKSQPNKLAAVNFFYGSLPACPSAATPSGVSTVRGFLLFWGNHRGRLGVVSFEGDGLLHAGTTAPTGLQAALRKRLEARVKGGVDAERELVESGRLARLSGGRTGGDDCDDDGPPVAPAQAMLDAAARRVVRMEGLHNDKTTGVQFNAHLRCIVSSSLDGTVKLVPVEVIPKPERFKTSEAKGVGHALRFMGYGAPTVELPVPAEHVITYKGHHPNAVFSVSFYRKKAQFISCGMGREILIWRPPQRSAIAALCDAYRKKTRKQNRMRAHQQGSEHGYVPAGFDLGKDRRQAGRQRDRSRQQVMGSLIPTGFALHQAVSASLRLRLACVTSVKLRNGSPVYTVCVDETNNRLVALSAPVEPVALSGSPSKKKGGSTAEAGDAGGSGMTEDDIHAPRPERPSQWIRVFSIVKLNELQRIEMLSLSKQNNQFSADESAVARWLLFDPVGYPTTTTGSTRGPGRIIVATSTLKAFHVPKRRAPSAHHSHDARVTAVLLSDTLDLLISVDVEGTVCVWDVRKGTLLNSRSRIVSLVKTEDRSDRSKKMLSPSRGGTGTAAGGVAVSRFATPLVTAAALDETQQRLILGTNLGVVSVWNIYECV